MNPKINRNRVERFARYQPISQPVYAENSCYLHDSENGCGYMIYKDCYEYQLVKQEVTMGTSPRNMLIPVTHIMILPKFIGYEYFEDILDWILDIEDFFEYVVTPAEERWRYF